MVGGQTIDIETEGKNPSIETIKEMYSKKTGALIKAACLMGCSLAGADAEKLKAAEKYAEKIGLAFQIVDDILDVTSTVETLGKPIGSDSDNEKVNYVTEFGIERSREIVSRLTKEAVEILTAFDGDTSFLKELALNLSERAY